MPWHQLVPGHQQPFGWFDYNEMWVAVSSDVFNVAECAILMFSVAMVCFLTGMCLVLMWLELVVGLRSQSAWGVLPWKVTTNGDLLKKELSLTYESETTSIKHLYLLAHLAPDLHNCRCCIFKFSHAQPMFPWKTKNKQTNKKFLWAL